MALELFSFQMISSFFNSFMLSVTVCLYLIYAPRVVPLQSTVVTRTDQVHVLMKL